MLILIILHVLMFDKMSVSEYLKPFAKALMETIPAIQHNKTKTYIFKILVEPDEDQWFAYCPLLEHRGAATWGHTREEALKNIREVMEMTIESMIGIQAQWTEEDLKRLGIIK